MTKGETKTAEADTMVFFDASSLENRSSDAAEAIVGEAEIEEQTIKIELKDRFARLKKSLRKRSVSIL